MNLVMGSEIRYFEKARDIVTRILQDLRPYNNRNKESSFIGKQIYIAF